MEWSKREVWAQPAQAFNRLMEITTEQRARVANIDRLTDEHNRWISEARDLLNEWWAGQEAMNNGAWTSHLRTDNLHARVQYAVTQRDQLYDQLKSSRSEFDFFQMGRDHLVSSIREVSIDSRGWPLGPHFENLMQTYIQWEQEGGTPDWGSSYGQQGGGYSSAGTNSQRPTWPPPGHSPEPRYTAESGYSAYGASYQHEQPRFDWGPPLPGSARSDHPFYQPNWESEEPLPERPPPPNLSDFEFTFSASATAPPPEPEPEPEPLLPLTLLLEPMDRWREFTAQCFQDYASMTVFPDPSGFDPVVVTPCSKRQCLEEQRALLACQCQVRVAFEGLEINPRREMIRWHPDKFSRCPAEKRALFQAMATEVFQVLSAMNDAR
ncbi:hypothetical protein Slin14017_G087600 [Septoria linicola]|nr:hypothetical protein Slin14017_G087600 [Septoria linicola]